MVPRNVMNALLACVLIAALAACSGSGGSSPPSDRSAPVQVDGTFTFGLKADPGSLDPHGSLTAGVRQLAFLAYDTLITQVDGKMEPHLAASWEESPKEIIFTLKPDVACSDGSPLTASDVAANVSYVADAKNKSQLLGLAVPVGAKATADDASAIVTITTPQPTGFLLQKLSILPIVCRSGLEDRSTLKQETAGTGPYTLTEAVPGDHYTFARSAGYTWGPDGATTATPGMPKTITARVVPNQTTTANLLLAGELNAATVSGPEVSRLEGAGLASHDSEVIWGEIFFNQAQGHPGADPETRKALVQALDLDELMTVSTAGQGAAPTRLTGTSPCSEDSVSGSLPSHDRAAAEAALTSLSGETLRFLYSTELGEGIEPASELATSMWKEVGLNVEAQGMATSDLFNTLYATGDWDIVVFPADGNFPSDIAANVSGPTPAKGGNNFADIRNSFYDTLSARANKMPDTTGCATWAEAERSLMRAADIVPFSVQTYPTWENGATFDMDGVVTTTITPTSIRVRQ